MGKFSKTESDWAEKGFRYWGTAKYQCDGVATKDGEKIIRTVAVLDRPNEPVNKNFYFADVDVSVNPKKKIRRNGEPFTVGTNLAPAIRTQLINVDKIKKGWNPVQ